jgi:hypothetical protein
VVSKVNRLARRKLTVDVIGKLRRNVEKVRLPGRPMMGRRGLKQMTRHVKLAKPFRPRLPRRFPLPLGGVAECFPPAFAHTARIIGRNHIAGVQIPVLCLRLGDDLDDLIHTLGQLRIVPPRERVRSALKNLIQIGIRLVVVGNLSVLQARHHTEVIDVAFLLGCVQKVRYRHLLKRLQPRVPERIIHLYTVKGYLLQPGMFRLGSGLPGNNAC